MSIQETARLRVPYYSAQSGEDYRVRSAGLTVISGQLSVPEMPPSVCKHLMGLCAAYDVFGPGDISGLESVDALSETWPDVLTIGAKVDEFLALHEIFGAKLKNADVYGCNTAPFHTDVLEYAESCFCIVWLDVRPGFVLSMPDAGAGIPLEYGTIVLFDSAVPHAVLPAGEAEWDAAHAVVEALSQSQVFLSYDFSVENESLCRALGITDLGRQGPEVDRRPSIEGRPSRYVCNTTGNWDY